MKIVFKKIFHANHFYMHPVTVSFLLIGVMLYYFRVETMEEIFNNFSFRLSIPEIILLVLILGIIIFLIVREWKEKLVSQYLVYVFKDNRRSIALFILISTIALSYYFDQGYVYRMDALHHLAQIKVISENMIEGRFPLWTFYWGAGYPFSQFYTWLAFIYFGLLNLILGDIHFSVKLGIFFLHLGSGIAMFYLVKELVNSPLAAFLSGWAYILVYSRMYEIVTLGKLYYPLIYLFLPLTFYFLERYFNAKTSRKSAIFAGLSLSIITITHPWFGLFTMEFFIVYSVFRILFFKEIVYIKIKRLSAILFCLGLALILSGFFTIPMYFQKGWTSDYLSRLLSSRSSSEYPGRIQEVLPGNLYTRSIYPGQKAMGKKGLSLDLYPSPHHGPKGSYVGLSLLGSAIIGLGAIFTKLKDKGVAVAVCTLLSLFLVVGYKVSFYRYIPLVFAVDSSARFLIFVVFFMSLLVGYSFTILVQTIEARFKILKMDNKRK